MSRRRCLLLVLAMLCLVGIVLYASLGSEPKSGTRDTEIQIKIKRSGPVRRPEIPTETDSTPDELRSLVLKGTVVDEQLHPVAGAQVVLWTTQSRSIST